MLQKRYDLPDGSVFEASGTMREIKGGPKWLYPLFKIGVNWKLLFLERGKNVPFSIKNTAFPGSNGESQIHWERIFHFGSTKRYFNALMSLDEKRLVIKDYLGEPPLVYSDLAFDVSDDGSLTIHSLNQRLVLGKVELPLPKSLQGLATVTECYDEAAAVYRINVNVRNPLIGHVFSYEGEFVQDA
nr:DUF4166 domain-containing protein [Sporosarcina luteola]